MKTSSASPSTSTIILRHYMWPETRSTARVLNNVALRYLYLREIINEEHVSIHYIPTEKRLAGGSGNQVF